MMSIAISDKPGNPAHSIKTHYHELMLISDPMTLRERALGIAAVGGISEKNKKKFVMTVTKETGLDRLRQYLTNFLLAADGLSVI